MDEGLMITPAGNPTNLQTGARREGETLLLGVDRAAAYGHAGERLPGTSLRR